LDIILESSCSVDSINTKDIKIFAIVMGAALCAVKEYTLNII